MSNCGGIYVADSDSCAVKDTVIWGNVADRQAGDGAPNFNAGVTKPTFSHVCSSFEKGDGSMAANPMFADAANGDYRIGGTSPCAYAGVYQSWMDGAVDLFGNPRTTPGKKVSIGCCQAPDPGLTLIVK